MHGSENSFLSWTRSAKTAETAASQGQDRLPPSPIADLAAKGQGCGSAKKTAASRGEEEALDDTIAQTAKAGREPKLSAAKKVDH